MAERRCPDGYHRDAKTGQCVDEQGNVYQGKGTPEKRDTTPQKQADPVGYQKYRKQKQEESKNQNVGNKDFTAKISAKENKLRAYLKTANNQKSLPAVCFVYPMVMICELYKDALKVLDKYEEAKRQKAQKELEDGIGEAWADINEVVSPNMAEAIRYKDDEKGEKLIESIRGKILQTHDSLDDSDRYRKKALEVYIKYLDDMRSELYGKAKGSDGEAE